MNEDDQLELDLESITPIVGIAASAGGLEGFKKFLSHVQADTGAAFVLVPHLDPTHDSLMVEILSRETSMPVLEVRNAMLIEPNHVYVIPPNKDLAVSGDTFQLTTPNSRHGLPTAIDFFLDSLAAERGPHAIGIILSGTSNHGTVGLTKIHQAGGIVIAQQLETAQYDQMPRNAIATGLVDSILAPEQMGSALLEYLKGSREPPANAPTTVFIPEDQLQQVLGILKHQTKVEFQHYRSKMISRRIHRRMGIFNCESLSDYIILLEKSPDEIESLSRDLLIGVTEFFRDTDAFVTLQTQVVSDLIQRIQSRASKANASIQLEPLEPLRVWIPGCSSGEEAYSIAMLFLDALPVDQSRIKLKVFATDIDTMALVEARRGIYSSDRVARVSPDRMQKYFVSVGRDQWQVRPFLRECITFAPHNIMSDPPFSRLDLISCRNVLIYLEQSMQSRVIRLFHSALSDSGYLFLGPAESIGRDGNLFDIISKKWRTYRKLRAVAQESFAVPGLVSETRFRASPSAATRKRQTITNKPNELIQRLVLNEFAPASALVNNQFEIVSLLGPLVNYLEFPPGAITSNILEMARPGLRASLRDAIHAAFKTSAAIEVLDAQVKRFGKYMACTISVKPAVSDKDVLELVLVVLRDRVPFESGTSELGEHSANAGNPEILNNLDAELKSTREELRSTIDEYQSSTEDLKASNEEVMSMNEELQSANEELESSKEELQSLNEEMLTVNGQLQEKVEELDRSNNDINNLIACSELSAVFLDRELHIKRFTPCVADLLNLRVTDLGRPLSDFSHNFEDNNLVNDCQLVIDKTVPIEKVVWGKHSKPRCYLQRIIPYRTANEVLGVVITFFDLTERHMAEAESIRLANVLKDSNDAITIQDFDGNIFEWNHGAEAMYGYTEAESLNMNLFDTIPEDKRGETRENARRLSGKLPVETFETQRITKSGTVLDIELTMTPYRDARGRLVGFATTERDVTERKRIAQSLYTSAEKMRSILKTAIDSIIIFDSQGIVTSANPATERMFGCSQQELIGQSISTLVPSLEPETKGQNRDLEQRPIFQRFLGKGRELEGLKKDGSAFPIDLSISQVDHLGLFTGIIRDISENKQLQKQVLEIAEVEQRRIGQELHDGTGQELTGLALFASTLDDMLRDSPTPADQQTGNSWSLEDSVLATLRRVASRLTTGLADATLHVQQLSHGILPVQIEPDGLVSALIDLSASTNDLPGITCTFECPEPVLIDDNAMATHLYRIAQESVNNALKHGNPSQLCVALYQSKSALRLQIDDDGSGFDPSEPKKSTDDSSVKGFGLDIMRYRAAMIGGTLLVSKNDSGGITVRCMIPSKKAERT